MKFKVVCSALGLGLLTTIKAFAAVTVAPASGGTSISADTSAAAVSPSWTSLGAISISEPGNGKGDIASGTLVLKAPAGFEFNTARTNVTFMSARNITAASATYGDSSTLTISLTVSGTDKGDTLTIGGTGGSALQVRPTAGAPLTTRHIYRPTVGGGSATIAGITASVDGLDTTTTSFGNLSEVAGNATQLAFTQEPASATVGAAFGTQPVVRTRDQFGNNTSAGLPLNLNVDFALAAGTGPLLGTTTFDIGSAAGNGIVSATNLQIDVLGADKQLSATAAGLSSALSGVFAVSQGIQTINFTTIATHTYGDSSFTVSATASSGLPVTFAVTAGPASVVDDTVTITGAGSVTIEAIQVGNADWLAATNSQTFTVNKATPVVTWSNPADIVYGTLLDGTQLNATAPVAGTFIYSPASGTQLSGGSNQNLSVTFQPTDSANYSDASASVSINVLKATQTITFDGLSDKLTTDGSFTVTATASSGLSVSFSASGPATVSGNSVTLDGTTGFVTIHASQSGNGNYEAASDVDQSFNVSAGTPSITWSNPSDITYGTALGTNELNAITSVPGTFTYDPTNGAVLNAGTNQTLSVTFVPDDTNSYNSASASVSINVVKATPVISWNNPSDIVYGTALSAAELNATANTAGTFTYSPTNGTVLNAGASQTLSLSFVPDDAANYNSATASVSINVLKATPVITWNNPSDIVYGTALSAAQLNATSSVAGTLTYSPDVDTILNAGTQTLSVGFVPTDSSNYENASASVSINVAKAPTTITWSNPANVTYGTLLSGTQLNASASVPGTLVYTPAAGTQLNAGTNELSVTFSPANSTNYLGTNASVSIVVDKATPVITWSNPADITYGAALGSTQLNATADVAGTFTYNPTNGTILSVGDNQTLTVDFVPTDSANYNNATASVAINVIKATPTIAWSNPATITYGTALDSTQLNAVSSIPGTLTYSPTNGTVLNAGAGQTLSVSFEPTDTANYNSTATNVLITVSKATPSITWSNPADIVYGTALSSVELNASASVPGTLTYTPASGAVLNAGSQTLSVNFVPDDAGNYNNTSASVTLNVTKAPVTVTWNNPADINYGAALSATQLNATATTAGTFTYSPASGTVLAAGSGQTLSVNFTPTSANYSNASASVSINVQKVSLIVKANDTTRVVGSSNPTFTASYTGFVNGDTASSLTAPVVFSTVADSFSPAGFYEIVPSAAVSGNYNITYLNGLLTVTPSSVIISTTTGGNWSSPATWVGGVVPTAADNVVIAAEATVSVDVAAECFSLTLSNSTALAPTFNVLATKSLVVGGGSGLVTVGQNVIPTNGMRNNLLNVAGSLNCGNVNLVARRSVNNDRIHAFLRLSNASAVVSVTNNIVQDRNTVTGGLLSQVDFTAAGLLKVGGGFVSVGQGGSLVAGTGTVEYNALGNQTIAPFTYNNLTLSGSGTKSGSAATVIGAAGTLALKDAAVYGGATPTYTSGATLLYNRTGAQSTGSEIPTTPPAVWNLSVNNAAGVTLSQSVSVPGTLRLIDGALITGANVVTANGTTIRTAGAVVGNLKKSFATGAGVARTFEVGLASGYNPVAITIANVSTAGSLTVSANVGDQSAISSSILDASKSVNANWTINADGVLAFDAYNAAFNFNSSDLDAGATPSLLIVGNYSSGSWTYPAVASRTATSVQANGLTIFGDFQLAENGSKTVSTISWSNPSDIVYGTALDATQLNATSTTAGVLTYSPASGTVLDAGNAQTLTVTLAPADPANYTAATNSVTINVAKANLSVTADSFSRFVGEANPTLTGSLVGVVNGDSITASYATAATAASAAGAYPITATLNDPSSRLGNYNVSNTSGTLTVLGAPVLNISGNVTLQVVGPTNLTYTIQATEDLGGTWQTIGTTTLGVGGVQEFQDVAPANANKYYRIAQ